MNVGSSGVIWHSKRVPNYGFQVVNSAGYQYRYLPYACLPGSGGAGAGAQTADQGRATDRGDGRLRAGCQTRLASGRSVAKPRCCSHRVSTSNAPSWRSGQAYAATELRPICLRLRELILASGKIAVDETVAPINVKVHRILAGNEPDLKIRE